MVYGVSLINWTTQLVAIMQQRADHLMGNIIHCVSEKSSPFYFCSNFQFNQFK